jgi:hypothetical protein
MPPISRFDPPAKIRDFPRDSQKQAQLDQLWDQNAVGWTRQAILGNPWNARNSSHQDFYYNPKETDIPASAAPIRVPWTAKPNRIDFYFSNLSQTERWSLADTGFTTTGTTFTRIPPPGEICGGGAGERILFGPYGPRGWQDEYCEWSVLRNDRNQIIRIDFTCENPEYWYMLWRVDPERVVELYRETLNEPKVTLADLQLSFRGQLVIDPFTGKPAYNPLNRWNFGPRRASNSGGAMHLTSLPNTLQTEMQLAGGATILRTSGNSDANALLCCGQFGQPRRNSDPTIGQGANITVEDGNIISLANPIGLYIQPPSFAGYRAPQGDPASFWTVKRGSATPLPGFPANSSCILHAAYEVPPELGFTVSDITINGLPIQWAAQIAATFQVALFPLPIRTTRQQTPQPCVVFLDPVDAAPQPLQLMFANLWDAYQGTAVANPVQGPATLAGNTTISPLSARPGGQYELVLTLDSLLTSPAPQLSVAFVLPGSTQPDPHIRVTVGRIDPVTYNVPGNSYPNNYHTVRLTIYVAGTAPQGPRDILVNNPRQKPGIAAPAYLIVEN